MDGCRHLRLPWQRFWLRGVGRSQSDRRCLQTFVLLYDYVSTQDPDDLSELVTALDGDNRLQYFVPKREKKFFEEQSEMMATFIRILGLFITIIFSTGATIGAMITMYGAVCQSHG